MIASIYPKFSTDPDTSSRPQRRPEALTDGHEWVPPATDYELFYNNDSSTVSRGLPLQGDSSAVSSLHDFVRETLSAIADSYSKLERSIAASRERIMEFSENDDQRVTMLAEFERARSFVLNCFEACLSTPLYFSHIPVPSIDIGPEESVDVNWVEGDRRLLLNFSPFEPKISFAGIQVDGSGPSIQGFIDPDAPNAWIMGWLVE